MHEDHTATVRSPQGLRKKAARASCDIPAISMKGCRDSTMTVQSPNGLSMALHKSVVEIRQRNRTMAVLMLIQRP